MSYTADDLTQPAPPSQLWQGFFAEDVSAPGLVTIILPDFDPALTWEARYGGGPADQGDDCLVIFDNDRQPWVISPTGADPVAAAAAADVAACITITRSAADMNIPGGWGKYPLNGHTTVIEPSGKFTVNADGSVSVAAAGWYYCSAHLGAIIGGDATNQYYGSIRTDATPMDGDVANGMGTGNYPRFSMGGLVKRAAGGKVFMHHIGGGSSAGQNVGRLFGFSMYRVQ